RQAAMAVDHGPQSRHHRHRLRRWPALQNPADGPASLGDDCAGTGGGGVSAELRGVGRLPASRPGEILTICQNFAENSRRDLFLALADLLIWLCSLPAIRGRRKL